LVADCWEGEGIGDGEGTSRRRWGGVSGRGGVGRGRREGGRGMEEERRREEGSEVDEGNGREVERSEERDGGFEK